jgi:hypothetical protein
MDVCRLSDALLLLHRPSDACAQLVNALSILADDGDYIIDSG